MHRGRLHPGSASKRACTQSGARCHKTEPRALRTQRRGCGDPAGVRTHNGANHWTVRSGIEQVSGKSGIHRLEATAPDQSTAKIQRRWEGEFLGGHLRLSSSDSPGCSPASSTSTQTTAQPKTAASPTPIARLKVSGLAPLGNRRITEGSSPAPAAPLGLLV